MDVNELSGRLERLERENRRMKRAGLAVVGVALVVACVGATAPEEIPEVIKARSLQLIDEAGIAVTMSSQSLPNVSDHRIVSIDADLISTQGFIEALGLTAESEFWETKTTIGPDGVVIYDENKNERATMTDVGFAYYDENDTLRASMEVLGFYYLDENEAIRARLGDSGVVIQDENPKVRASMDDEGFSYYDENRKLRAALGVVETVTTKTGEESRYPAGVALFDDDGKVIWMRPN